MKTPIIHTAATLAVFLSLFVVFGGTQAAAHPAGACQPVLKVPNEGQAVTPEFDIKVFGNLVPDNCQIDRMTLHVFDKDRGTNVFSRDIDCCDVITNYKPLIDMTVPAGELQPDTNYQVVVRFYDKHIGFSPGSDPAIVNVKTTVPQYRTKRQAQQFDPMAFALDKKGRFGHGRGKTEKKARDVALGFCDAPGCTIVSEPVRARCHALAQRTQGGFWWGVGAADTQAKAQQRAERFCEQNQSGQCRIDYTYCQ
ncbi:DUF4189 domain-containing protein [Sediminimonas qiaohouensis]|uniref:DUF4189 domain-containing protein n=1 Tax=Sediminimonas qiaohouensis TaxID=552061 RepID=UPI0004176666|nr:DUF4189 domain-containing protein [Sediminimonas qiaohouensis]